MSSSAPPATTATPSELLASLARLSTARFSSFAEASEVYLSTAARLIGVRSAFISRLDNRVMEVLNAWDADGCNIPPDGVVPLEDTFCQYVRADGAPVIVDNAALDPRVANVATRRDFGIGSYLGVPLVADDGAFLGTFCLLDPKPQQFGQDQLRAVEVLAQQLVRLVERELAERAAVRIERETAEDLGAALSALDERDLLLRTVAHDLRTPLTSIRGYADMLAQRLFGEITPAQQRAFDRIDRSSRYMNRLINDLLDLSSMEGGGLVLSCEPYRPAELAELVGQLCVPEAAERGLELEIVAPPDTPAAIGDPIRVQQILTNLISNALSYSEQGTVRLRVAARGGQVEYTVSDSGRGIGPAALPHIWELGWRAGQGGYGTGLGLYLVRRLTEAMGGSADVESAPGMGSTFTIRLPLEVERPMRASLI